ncbi:MAG TPA: N-methyl-L-tryptophan oxidase, partial [Phototrophicaceae bacterium]|nr:N-methyl-L-tryptophan oxidase [Phototrophicaceae bacterium]
MYDLIVIGAGVIGSATAYQAAKAGRRVLLLEQFAVDHQRGSSYGYSRIIRYAYDHPYYVELAKDAFAAWDAFEQDAGETFYTRTGGIDFGTPSEPLLVKMMDSMSQVGIPYEVLSADELKELFPQFQLEDDMVALYQADAGLLRASKAVQANVRLAKQYGADMRDNSPVTSITPLADGVEVKTATDTFTADKLVMAPGAWLKPMLLPLGLDLPLQPIAPQENYFTPLVPDQFTPEHFPVWIGHLQAEYGQILYGLPSVDGSGVKIGLHTGPAIDPNVAERTPDAAVSAQMLDFAKRYMPQAAGGLQSSRVCLYTLTPDEHFVIDRHPEYAQIIVASCCSGHAFKFSPVLGSILSDLALKGETAHDLSLFSLSRFANV